MRATALRPRRRALAVAMIAATVAAMLTASGTAAGSAGTQRWLGPYGGSVWNFAVHPANADIILAASARGVFRSVDGGTTWAPSSAGLTNLRVGEIVFDPHAPLVVFAGTEEGLFRSADMGLTWTLAVQPGPKRWGDGDLVLPQTIQSISISANVPGLMYVADAASGAHRTTDGGVTWTTLRDRDGWRVSSFRHAPSDDELLYLSWWHVATGAEESYRSDDGGSTWAPMSPTPAGRFVVAPGDPDTVFMVAGGSVVRSTDAGATWSPVWSRNDGAANSLSISLSNPARVYLAGVKPRWPAPGAFLARSDDGGVSWSSVTWLPSAPRGGASVTVSPQNESTVYFGSTEAGFRRSSDGGATFMSSNHGLAAEPAAVVATDPNSAATWYASLRRAGTFRTNDGGLTWTDVTGGLETSGDPLALVDVRALVVDAASTVYAATMNGECCSSALFASSDGGATWVRRAAERWANRGITQLLAHPTSAETLLATHAGLAGGEGTGGVALSTDGGGTWTDVSPWPATRMAMTLDRATGSVYVAMGDGGEVPAYEDRLFVSDNFGQSWQRLPLPPADMHMETTSIAIAPGGRILLGGERGSFVTFSEDRGQRWERTFVDYTGRSSEVTALAVDPLDPLQVLAGTVYGGTWLSRDLGATWAPTSPGVYGETVKTFAFPAAFSVGDPVSLRSRPALVGGGGRSAAGVSRFTPRPHNIVRPAVSGVPRSGRTLRCWRGRWSRADRYSRQWLRSGNAIRGATGATYEIVAADRGHALRCRAAAAGPGGNARRGSAVIRVTR